MSDANTQNSAYLKIDNIWKSFGKFLALKDISLEIQEGEFVCFLGPSGCGKTTLLRAIAGLDLQTKGEIRQGGKDVSNLPPAERDYGIVFQSYALFPNLTIEKNIAFGLENTGRSKPEIDLRVADLLQLVGLPEQGKKYPAQLSGGQQQRIALARAIATKPGLLLLDEPLSALDAKVRVHLRQEIKALQQKLGVTTVMVTHDQEEALSMADRIVVMNDGRVEQIGTPSEVYCTPKTLFVADFIGEMNQLNGMSAGPEQVTIGTTKMSSTPHDFAPNSKIIIAIRPEDIVAHGMTETVTATSAQAAANLFEMHLAKMEFLGSFWRCKLRCDAFGENDVMADFSINAVRRLSLACGQTLKIELPAVHLLAFDLPVEPA
ncbi:MAG: putative 2-aminoethylphosphonate ABC transporter ATP-binding protein [Paracoccaceae bacterium]|nr:putative 2-aminoethylphosphonate ABC transporter ATP-binding protein [Paracoccaceae bacterium]